MMILFIFHISNWFALNYTWYGKYDDVQWWWCLNNDHTIEHCLRSYAYVFSAISDGIA